MSMLIIFEYECRQEKPANLMSGTHMIKQNLQRLAPEFKHEWKD
ncbi:10405_t:CDS:1, partial [Dentiscutata erythropus]